MGPPAPPREAEGQSGEEGGEQEQDEGRRPSFLAPSHPRQRLYLLKAVAASRSMWEGASFRI